MFSLIIPFPCTNSDNKKSQSLKMWHGYENSIKKDLKWKRQKVYESVG